MSGHLTVQEAAARLRQMDNVLLLTHVRPDGDTIGSAAALCQALRDMGKTAYLLYNPEITDTYAPYAAPYWAPADFAPAHIVSTDIAALNLLPDNAASYASRVELAIDHHGSQAFFAAETCLDVEAAACGAPILCLNATALPEIAQALGGTVVEPGDFPALCRAVRDLAAGPRPGRDPRVERYSRQAMLDRYLKLYLPGEACEAL